MYSRGHSNYCDRLIDMADGVRHMKCKYCAGRVEWRGFSGNGFTYTECLSCGLRNAQEPPEREEEEEEDYESDNNGVTS